MTATLPQKDARILIIGAGVFGASTAYHLLKRGFTHITVIDRAESLPAVDAASSDLNKIVRTSYSDPFYAQLAREAIADWKREFPGIYHESGVLVCGDGDYIDLAYETDKALGARLERASSIGDAQTTLFPEGVVIGGTVKESKGYLNKDGGWASAREGNAKMLEKVAALGGKVVPGKTVSKLLHEDGHVAGVVCADRTTYTAEVVVIATGAWTASAFPELGLSKLFVATGQSIATVQLTPEEAALYRGCPVVLDFQKGHYLFPPTADNVLKIASHSAGYTHTEISTPRTILSHGTDGLRIPKPQVDGIREFLSGIYPEIGKKPFSSTRLCWYTDTPDADWVIGPLPTHSNVFLATGGSGHGYKFLPNIGRLIADSVEGKLDPVLVAKFAPFRQTGKIDPRRLGAQPARLPEAEALSTAEDLLPPSSA